METLQYKSFAFVNRFKQKSVTLRCDNTQFYCTLFYPHPEVVRHAVSVYETRWWGISLRQWPGYPHTDGYRWCDHMEQRMCFPLCFSVNTSGKQYASRDYITYPSSIYHLVPPRNREYTVNVRRVVGVWVWGNMYQYRVLNTHLSHRFHTIHVLVHVSHISVCTLNISV